MRILIAPDKFKGSLGAHEVGQALAAGLRAVLPRAELDLVPLADGGEGTAEAIGQAAHGEWLTCPAHDPLGRALHARYTLLREPRTAVIDMSEAAGLRRLAPNELDPLRASTFGVGEMLRDAIGRGVAHVIIGLGGSATNDGGFGLARALGFRFCNTNGEELSGPIADLLHLSRIERPRHFALPAITAACDVRNPLLGPRGATRTFGPQKGATPEQLEILERALTQLAATVTRSLGCDHRDTAGAGAAGGLGFGLLSFCGAEIRSGFEVVAEAIGLRAKIQQADVVITGEGKLDRQTLEGKGPAGVARLARELHKPVYAIVGQVSDEGATGEIFDGVQTLQNPAGDFSRTAELLETRARELAAGLAQTHLA